MVRKLFGRPRSKTAGAASTPKPGIHRIDPLPRPDLALTGNVTTDISAGYDEFRVLRKHPGKSLDRHRLQRPSAHGQVNAPSQSHAHTHPSSHTSSGKHHAHSISRHPTAQGFETLSPPSSRESDRHIHHHAQQHRVVQSQKHAAPDRIRPLASSQTMPAGGPMPAGNAAGRVLDSHQTGQTDDERQMQAAAEQMQSLPTLRRRPSKWKQMGRLLKSKEVYSESSPAGAGATREPSLQTHDLPLPPPQRFDSPVTPQSARFSPPTPVRQAISPAPHLSLEMPDITLERYSVMFNRVVPASPESMSPDTACSASPTLGGSSLLSRRERRLQGLSLQGSTKSSSSDNLLYPDRPSTSASRQGSPLQPRLTSGARIVGPGRSPLRRSNTAPPSPSSPLPPKQAQPPAKHNPAPAVMNRSTATRTTTDAPAVASTSSVPSLERRRSMDSVASPSLLDATSSDDEEDFVDVCREGDHIILRARATSWEDPHEPRWEIINPRRSLIKTIVHPPRAPTERRQEQSQGSRGRRQPPPPTIKTQNISSERARSSAAAPQPNSHSHLPHNAATRDLNTAPINPALSRFNPDIPPIPPRSPARVSMTSMSSWNRSSQAIAPPSTLLASPRKGSLPAIPSIPSDATIISLPAPSIEGGGDVDPEETRVAAAAAAVDAPGLGRSISLSRRGRREGPSAGADNEPRYPSRTRLGRSRSRSTSTPFRNPLARAIHG